MVQFLIFVVSIILSFTIFGFNLSTAPANVTNGGMAAELSYMFSHTPLIILAVMVIIDIAINACLHVLLSKWRELPRTKHAYEKEVAKQREIDNTKAAVKERFKLLKGKVEEGKKLTVEEEKWLKNYMGPIWYATLKKKEG